MKWPAAYLARHRRDAGDTLVEVLLALTVLGLATVSLVMAFSTTIAASAEHRSLASLDSALRSAANEALTQIQSQGLYTPCATPSDYNQKLQFTSLTGGLAASVTGVQWWDGTSFPGSVSSPGTCSAGSTQASGPQLVTLSVSTSSGTSQSLSVAVQNPTAPAISLGGTATQLIFKVQPVGGAAGSPFPTQPVIWEADSSGQLSTASAAPVTLKIATGTPGTLTGCVGTVSLGVVTFQGCTISASGTYTITATSSGLTSATSNSITISSSSGGGGGGGGGGGVRCSGDMGRLHVAVALGFRFSCV